jgi:hypothetical protein
VTPEQAAAAIGVSLTAGISAVYTYPAELREEWLGRADEMGAEYAHVAVELSSQTLIVAFVVYNLEVARAVRALIELETS